MPRTTRGRWTPNAGSPWRVLDGPGTPEVLGDESRLRQVLRNLVANAIQHTPESADVTVRVGTEGDDAILEVADDGPGMSQEDALRVFERFYRADSSRARASGGTDWGCRSSTLWWRPMAERSP